MVAVFKSLLSHIFLILISKSNTFHKFSAELKYEILALSILQIVECANAFFQTMYFVS